VKVVKRCLFPVLSIALFLGGCVIAGPLVPIPRDLEEQSTAMTVERTRTLFAEPLQFGEWTVTAFKQDKLPNRSKTSHGSDRLRHTKSRGSAAYHFTMTGNDRAAWECRCDVKRNARGVEIGPPDNRRSVDLEHQESLECDLQRAANEPVWKLRVTGSLAMGEEGYEGTLSDGSRSISLYASHEIRNVGRLPGPPIGYVFVRDGEDIASAELLYPGAVRIGNDASNDRDLIATAAAALLLQPAVH